MCLHCLSSLRLVPPFLAKVPPSCRAFDAAIEGAPFLQRQSEPEGCVHSFWCYSLLLLTDTPEDDWFKVQHQRDGQPLICLHVLSLVAAAAYHRGNSAALER